MNNITQGEWESVEKMVDVLASKFASLQFSQEELYQIGITAVIESLPKRRDLNASITGFCYWHARGAIQKNIGKERRYIQSTPEFHNLIEGKS